LIFKNIDYFFKKGLTNGLELELKMDIENDYDFGELLINIHNFSYKSLDLENNG
jgi:hypothetical protein